MPTHFTVLHNEEILRSFIINENTDHILISYEVFAEETQNWFNSHVFFKVSTKLITERQQSSHYLPLTDVPNLVFEGRAQIRFL